VSKRAEKRQQERVRKRGECGALRERKALAGRLFIFSCAILAWAKFITVIEKAAQESGDGEREGEEGKLAEVEVLSPSPGLGLARAARKMH